MESLLKGANRQLATPDCSTAKMTPFTDQQVAASNGKSFVLPLSNVYSGKIFSVDSIPLHVHVPKVR